MRLKSLKRVDGAHLQYYLAVATVSEQGGNVKANAADLEERAGWSGESGGHNRVLTEARTKGDPKVAAIGANLD